MATYAIGDIQGCYREFLALLEAINFDPGKDRIWLTGDLVNRGPESLAVLREVIGLGKSAVTVLGNHDLHLLAVAHAEDVKLRRRDTLDDILEAPDRAQLLGWLRQQPLLHVDERLGFAMVHAGLPPSWTLEEACRYAREVEASLLGVDFINFLGAMYGDTPTSWDPSLSGMERLRFITNCLTRMRFCDGDGHLDLNEKGAPNSAPPGLIPWYAVPGRASARDRIVFGHWSTLRLDRHTSQTHRVYPLDTGAVWGGELTAMRLEDEELF